MLKSLIFLSILAFSVFLWGCKKEIDDLTILIIIYLLVVIWGIMAIGFLTMGVAR